MAVPVFEEFYYPIMIFASKGAVSRKGLEGQLKDYFHLSDDDCQVRTKSGNETKLRDRINWAIQYLKRALFLSKAERNSYQITSRGSEYLRLHKDLKKSDLMEYSEFADFVNQKRHSSKKLDDKTLPSVVNIQSEELQLTPTEQLDHAFQSIIDDLAEELLQKTLDQSPQFFEQLVVDLLVKMGYGGSFANSAMVTQFSHDEGIDGIIYEDKLGLDKIYIQAKRYGVDKTIGSPQIQQFAGALAMQKATKGVFITTSTYTKDARDCVGRLDKKIVLIDGKELAHYMIEYNVGVSVKKIYEVNRLDSDYFDQD